MSPETDTGKVDRLLDALGDPSRRAMVGILARGPRSVSGLAEALGITLTAVGQHLLVLQVCRLVHSEKSGRVRMCRLDPHGFTVLGTWASQHQATWNERLDGLGEMLDDTGV